MSAIRDDVANSDGLLAAAAERACVFDFAAAEQLCQRVLVLEEPGPVAARAQALMRANDYNRTSYLYDLALKRPVQSEVTMPAPISATRRLHDAWTRLWRPAKAASVGSFEVRFDGKFMLISGSIRDESRLVHLFINELLVASAPTVPPEPGARPGGTSPSASASEACRSCPPTVRRDSPYRPARICSITPTMRSIVAAGLTGKAGSRRRS